MAGLKDFSDLKSLRDQLKEESGCAPSRRPSANKRERIARERAVEFRGRARASSSMPESDRYVWRPMQEAELRGAAAARAPAHRDEEIAAVLAESMLSDRFDVDGLLDEDPALSWSAPGVGPDVVKKLRKRHWQVEDELDLHGLTRDLARAPLSTTSCAARNKRGMRCVRIIHGVGYGSARRRAGAARHGAQLAGADRRRGRLLPGRTMAATAP